MNERRLSDNDINEWFDVPKFIVPFAPWPYTKSQLQQQLLSQPLINRGGPFAIWTKPGSSRKQWWGFESEYYDIAIKTNGTVVVKGHQHRRLTLWIRPDGEAGTTEEKDLDLNHLANEKFAQALLVLDINEQIAQWASRVKRRKIPGGPSLLLKKSVDALAWRKNEYNEAEEVAKTGFFFHIMTWEWPF